jgi:hypothetical protein
MMKVLRTKKQKRLANEEGYAIFEAVTFLTAFLVFAVYVIDLFTAVHTGIVNSIAARTYAFESFQHRSNLSWLRQEDAGNNPSSTLVNFSFEHARFHSVVEETPSQDDSNIISVGRTLTQASTDGNNNGATDQATNQKYKTTNVIKIKAGYGICLDSRCPAGPGL